MAATSLSQFLLLISLSVFLIAPACSLNCTSQKLPNSKIKKYLNCTDLPTLNSTLHYTYDATNSSLSVAFVAEPPSSDGWIAWAINPTTTGMIGAQALIAYKSNGTPVVKTYNLTSYGFINESNLSFDVWDRSAAEASGNMVIYATVKVPARAEKLNQVWQVGPLAGGRPSRHDLGRSNLESKGELVLVANASSLSPARAPSPSGVPNSGTGSGQNNGTWWVRPGKMGLWAGALVFFVSSALV